MKKIFILFLLFLVSAIASNAQQKDFSLTNKDKTAIIKTILIDHFDLPNSVSMPGEIRNTIYLSTKNIESVRLPEIKGIKFILLGNKSLIRAKEEGLVYGVLGRFVVRGSKVTVRFGFYNNVGSLGSILTFSKVRGQWEVVASGNFGSGQTEAF
jgi:hypothetical protein